MTAPDAAARPKKPLTFEDMLILFMRRFLAPVAASSLVIGGLLFLFAAMMGLQEADMGLLFVLFLAPAAISAAGLALFGIPAGYLVARLKRGFRQSLWLLVGAGAAAGLILTFILMLIVGGGMDSVTPVVFSLAGAVVAGLWALLNADLFRGHNGA
jgi:hypothetical protein